MEGWGGEKKRLEKNKEDGKRRFNKARERKRNQNTDGKVERDKEEEAQRENQCFSSEIPSSSGLINV